MESHVSIRMAIETNWQTTWWNKASTNVKENAECVSLQFQPTFDEYCSSTSVLISQIVFLCSKQLSLHSIIKQCQQFGNQQNIAEVHHIIQKNLYYQQGIWSLYMLANEQNLKPFSEKKTLLDAEMKENFASRFWHRLWVSSTRIKTMYGFWSSTDCSSPLIAGKIYIQQPTDSNEDRYYLWFEINSYCLLFCTTTVLKSSL